MRVAERTLLLWIIAFWMGANPANAKGVHVVVAGDTLWDISREVGCESEDIRQENELNSTGLHVGQKLRIPTCTTENNKPLEDSGRGTLHTVVQGDTLRRLAIRYNSTVDDIMNHNNLSNERIYVGRELHIPEGREEGVADRLVLGQSVGLPYDGRLRRAARLRPGRGYVLRRPERSYGATHTVRGVRRAIKAVRRRHQGLHALAIGDLSVRRGGKISMHVSHQSGRDVDLGFYFQRRPKGYPEQFVVATKKNLHFDATWTLLTNLAKTAGKPGGVERMFLSYRTQKLLYQLARKRGVSRQRLRSLLQYPHGPSSQYAIVRHEPGHDEHVHVRFQCPPNDKACN